MISEILIASALTAAPPSPPVPQPMLLNGKPFPLVSPYVPQARSSRRTVVVGPADDLQKAACALAPGDLLRVKKGTYAELRIDDLCRDGTPENPIQIFFERGATVPALTVEKSYWDLDNALVSGSGVRIGAVRDVTISNCSISRTDINLGAREIHLINNRVRLIHIDGGSSIELIGNIIRDDQSIGIRAVKASDLRIVNNTLSGVSGTRGIELDEVDGAVIRSNHISHYGVAISVGRSDEKERSVQLAKDITIDHNDLETTAATGVAFDIEAGKDIRFVNNVIEGYADGIVVLGKRQTTGNVVIANNLVLRVSRTAFVLRDPATVGLFDFNVFSPTRSSVDVQIGNKTLALTSYLRRRTMPHTQQVSHVTMAGRDLGRIEGVETVDRGKPIPGIAFEGRAPDLGVAER